MRLSVLPGALEHTWKRQLLPPFYLCLKFSFCGVKRTVNNIETPGKTWPGKCFAIRILFLLLTLAELRFVQHSFTTEPYLSLAKQFLNEVLLYSR